MNPSIQDNPWFAYVLPRPQARLRLFCFPHAGGGASLFRGWQSGLPAAVEVLPVQPPGREARMLEKPFMDLGTLVSAVISTIRPYLGPRFAFFGHSMGARVAFEVARSLRRQGGPQPVGLFVSGDAAPHLPSSSAPIHALPKDEFIQELRRLNGTPGAILDSPELSELLLPLLRADLTLVESYVYEPDAPLDCPISAFGGLQDPEAERSGLEAWRQQTRSSFSLHMFPGDHFFVINSKTAVLEALSQELCQLTSRTQREPARLS